MPSSEPLRFFLEFQVERPHRLLTRSGIRRAYQRLVLLGGYALGRNKRETPQDAEEARSVPDHAAQRLGQ